MIRKAARPSVLALGVVFVLNTASAKATVLFESAPPDDSLLGQTGGASIDYSQFLGARFSVSDQTQVTAVGGNLSGDIGGLFAVIVRLSGPTALPRMGGDYFNPTPFNDADIVAHTTFALGTGATADVRISMSATLTPGWYGLVYGSYLWGAYGDGGMATGGQNYPGTSFFGFTSGAWQEYSANGKRFVVEGTPEPSTILTLVLGFAGTRISSRTRRRHA